MKIFTFVFMYYSEKIKKRRKERGYSQAEMAEKVGISQAAYGKIESGFTKSVTIEVGKGIAAALDISFTDLFEIENDNSKTRLLELNYEKLQNDFRNLKEQYETLKIFADHDKRKIELANENWEELKELRMLTSMFELIEFLKINELIKDHSEALGLIPPLIDASGKNTNNEISGVEIKISHFINFFRHYGKNEALSIIRKYIDIPRYSKSALIQQESKESGKSVTRIIQELKNIQGVIK
ncbi:MAG: helix-turn-helix transcriptional regulator [Bacteroidales bacterium]|nr:helix-turn-helix transcriptional regulator [Bacteroidales bacterium]